VELPCARLSYASTSYPLRYSCDGSAVVGRAVQVDDGASLLARRPKQPAPEHYPIARDFDGLNRHRRRIGQCLPRWAQQRRRSPRRRHTAGKGKQAEGEPSRTASERLPSTSSTGLSMPCLTDRSFRKRPSGPYTVVEVYGTTVVHQ